MTIVSLLNPFNIGAIIPFASLYESKQALTVLQKQRFVEWFSGKDIDTIWTKTNVLGTNTFTMSDAIDEGFKITTGTTSGDLGLIGFNNIRHYSNTASILIAVMKAVESTTRRISAGFRNTITSSETNAATVDNDTLNSFYVLRTADGTTSTTQNSDVSLDEVFRVHQIKVQASDVLLFIDGVLKVTKTTNLPVAKMQPTFFVKTRAASARNGLIRYLEVYNT